MSLIKISLEHSVGITQILLEYSVRINCISLEYSVIITHLPHFFAISSHCPMIFTKELCETCKFQWISEDVDIMRIICQIMFDIPFFCQYSNYQQHFTFVCHLISLAKNKEFTIFQCVIFYKGNLRNS